MRETQSMDRGIRIVGGLVLIILAFGGGGLDSIDTVVALTVGLYGLITGIFNFCPLCHFILKEKQDKRKKTAAEHAVTVKDAKVLKFFEGLTDDEVGKVLSHAQLKKYPPEVKVLDEGTHKKILSIIYSGKFKLVKSIAEGENKIIGTISDGDTYGELSFFDHQPPSVSVLSMENSKVLEIDEIGFSELMGRNPYLAIKILSRLMKISSARIRVLNEQISTLGNWVVQSRKQMRANPAVQ